MWNGSSPGRTVWWRKTSPYTYSRSASANMCNTYDGNMQEQKVSIFLKKQGLNGNWLVQVSCKENQNKCPECESFRNSIFLLLGREWSYSLPPWKLPSSLTVRVLISFCPGDDNMDFFPPEFDLIPDKIFKSGALMLCLSKYKQRKKLWALLHKDKRLQEESCENEEK